MRETRKERCDKCRFWDCSVNNLGDCHRYPPLHDGEIWDYPLTCEDEWCGEFKAVEGEK